MSNKVLLVLFSLDGQPYALNHNVVERVLSAVEITPLPQAPEIVLGIINLHGSVIPVFNIRRRFGLPERALSVNDQFIVAVTAQRMVALHVDRVINIFECGAEQLIPTEKVMHGAIYISAIAKEAAGLVLIHDLNTFLALAESAQLDSAIEQLE